MNIRLGQKIKSLRKAKNISQEVLAQYLGVSFQAVSKWETETAMPDVTLIPAIASFFEVSTDELFDFNLLETEKRVEEICNEAYRWRDTDSRKAEQILRKGLQQYPGNDILLNNLLYTMRSPARAQEVIDLCRVLIEGAKHEDVRYDAMRILAETYKEQGEYALCKAAIAQIPEIYFSKQQLDALLLEGEDMFGAAWGQKHVAAQDLLHMFLRLSDYYQSKGQLNQAKSQLTMLIAIGDTLQSDLEDQNGYYPRCYREITEAAKKKLSQL